MQEVYDFLKKCQTYYLATTEGNQPRVRPFGTIDLFQDKLYIQTGKGKDVSRQMLKNPQVELCAFDGDTWIRLAATAVEDDRLDARTHMLDAYPDLKSMYQADDGNCQVFYLKDATATLVSFSPQDTAPKVIKF